MNALSKHKSIRKILCIACVLVSICSCSSDENTEQLDLEVSQEASEQVEVSEIYGEAESGGIVSLKEDQEMDLDQDGLPDSIDLEPEQALTMLSGDTALSIANLGTVINSKEQSEQSSTLANAVIMGRTIAGKINNTAYYAGPFYLLWHKQDEISYQVLELDTNGEFTVDMIEIMPNAVSIATPLYVSEPYHIMAYAVDEPVLFDSSDRVYTGSTVELGGINLEKIETVSIGEQTLSFSVVEEKLHVDIPKQATSKQLVYTSGSHQRFTTLPLYRSISLSGDSSVSNASDWSALSEDQKLRLVSHNNSVFDLPELSLSVGEQLRFVRFYHDQHRDLQAVIWPDSEHITMGTRATIEAAIVARLRGGLTPEGHALVQYFIQDYLNSDIGVQASIDLDNLHKSDYSIKLESALSSTVDDALEYISEQSSAINSILAKSYDWPSNSNTQGVFDYLDDTFTAIFASNTMYEPIMSVVGLQARPGSSTYSGMKIGMYRDLTVCTGLESVNLPAGIWPSDLCVKNTGVYFASLQVTNPVTKTVVKSHVKEYLDTNMIGATGWGILSLSPIGYITSDAGTPLCHMQPCEMEFITGGFGVGTNINLSKTEEKIHDIVFGRTIMERVILPILTSALGLAADQDQTSRCLVTHIVTNAPTSSYSYGTMISEFKKKVDSANNESEVIGTIKETVVKYAYDLAAGMLSTQKLPSCLPAALRQEYLSSLANKVGDFAEKVSVPLRFADIAVQQMQGFEAIITPEKFTFDIAPRAAITSVYTSNSTNGTPELFSNIDSNSLYIRGTKFVYLQSDGTNYWPKLRLIDRYGNKQTLQLNESHKVDISDLSWVDIKIPMSDLRPLMKNLRGETINVSIIMDDDDYSEFSSEGLPLPGRDIKWVGQPKITIARPSIMRAGRLLSLKGENLQSFAARSDLKLTLIQANDSTKTGEILRVESSSESSIKFRLPSTLPTNTYKLKLETSDSTLFLDVPDNVSKDGLTGAITVIPQNASTLQILDSGAKIDDGMIVYVSNSDNKLISQNDSVLSLELAAGNNNPSVWMWWNDTGLSASSGDTIPHNVLVACQQGGTDQICTYRVKGEVNVNGSFKSVNFRGKLKDAEEQSYSIN